MSKSTPLSGASLYLHSNVFVYAFRGLSGALREAAYLLVRRRKF